LNTIYIRNFREEKEEERIVQFMSPIFIQKQKIGNENITAGPHIGAFFIGIASRTKFYRRDSRYETLQVYSQGTFHLPGCCNLNVRKQCMNADRRRKSTNLQILQDLLGVLVHN
jgi:hypothetical protein